MSAVVAWRSPGGVEGHSSPMPTTLVEASIVVGHEWGTRWTACVTDDAETEACARRATSSGNTP